MLDFLLLANLYLVLAALIVEVGAIRKPEYRFARLVGIAGLALLAVGYGFANFGNTGEMPMEFLRPGFFLFFAYNVARGLYERVRR